MARSLRHGRVALAFLGVTGLLSLWLGTSSTLAFPAVRTLRVPGWMAGSTLVDVANARIVRLTRVYLGTAPAPGAWAVVETRCTPDPRSFLHWSGRLPYQGAGYQQLSVSTPPLVVRDGEGHERMVAVSAAAMRTATRRVVLLYAYVDHWGIHEQSWALWPHALGDLVLHHPGPYCMWSAAVTVTQGDDAAYRAARYLARAFLPVVARAIRP